MANLNHHNGILPIKLGEAKIILTYKNLVHIVKLDDYANSIDLIRRTLDSLVDTNSLNPLKNILNLKILELEKKLNTLLPKHRNKRGIINGLGSIIKIISGNMDADDAKRINEEISNINSNTKIISENLNRQIIINNGMMQRFNNITLHVNTQQEKIENYLKNMRKEMESNNKKLETIMYYNQNVNLIDLNINVLNEHLDNINEAFILSKLNIISKHILYPTELKFIYEILKNESIKIESDEQMYELLELQSFYSGNNIIFNIKIPIVKQKVYSFFRIIPIQINETYLIPVQPFAVMDQEDIFETSNRCHNIEKTFYCKISDLISKEDLQTCMRKIIENQPAKCDMIKKQATSSIIHVEDDYILCINIPETTFESTCGTPKSKIEGNILIRFQNCTITINGIKYDNTAITHWENLVINPTLNKDIKPSKVTEELSLEKLQTFNTENLREIEIIKEKHTYRDYATIITITIIIILIGITWIIQKFKKPAETSQPNIVLTDLRTKTPSHAEHNIIITDVRPASAIANSSNFLWPKL